MSKMKLERKSVRTSVVSRAAKNMVFSDLLSFQVHKVLSGSHPGLSVVKRDSKGAKYTDCIRIMISYWFFVMNSLSHTGIQSVTLRSDPLRYLHKRLKAKWTFNIKWFENKFGQIFSEKLNSIFQITHLRMVLYQKLLSNLYCELF